MLGLVGGEGGGWNQDAGCPLFSLRPVRSPSEVLSLGQQLLNTQPSASLQHQDDTIPRIGDPSLFRSLF